MINPQDVVREALMTATKNAITNVGLNVIRNMEFFGTNERRTSVKLAA